MKATLLTAAFLLFASASDAAEKIVKQTFASGGATRTYYLFVPERAGSTPSPLLILLHGSGRDGRVLLTYWEGLAKKEGIILAGPDASAREGWGMLEDGPHFGVSAKQSQIASGSSSQRRTLVTITRLATSTLAVRVTVRRPRAG